MKKPHQAQNMHSAIVLMSENEMPRFADDEMPVFIIFNCIFSPQFRDLNSRIFE
jgi:hypothetical protein